MTISDLNARQDSHEPLDRLRQPASIAADLAAVGLEVTAAVPDYVRHKPGETTIVAYRFSAADGEQTWGYIHWSAEEERADAVFNKALSLRPRASLFGPGLVRVDANTVLYLLPNDAKLRRLRWYTSARKLKRSLEGLPGTKAGISAKSTSLQVLRYKPERRLVVKANLGLRDGRTVPVVIRYGSRRQAGELAAVAAKLRANGVAAPAPIAQLDDDRVGVDRFVPGAQLRDAVQAGFVGKADASQMAAALTGFHATPPPSGCPSRTPEHDLVRVQAALAGLVDLNSESAYQAMLVAGLLISTEPKPSCEPGLVHGDLHPKNILVDDAGPIFVDLERAAVGHPAIDLGCLLGHAIALGIRQPGWSPDAVQYAEDVIEHYRLGTVVSAADLAWYTALALVDQAVLVTRHFEGDWRWNSELLLAEASEQLVNLEAGKA